MSRCKHKNISITEVGTAYTEHNREDGAWSHCSYLGEYTIKLHVECGRCGLKKTYTKQKPKWLCEYLHELDILNKKGE